MQIPKTEKKSSKIPYGAPSSAITPIPSPQYTPQQYAKMPGVGRLNLPGGEYFWNVSQEFINHPLVRQRFAQMGMDILRPGVPGPQGEYWLAHPAGEGKSFWQDARRIGRYYHALRNLPPGAQAPDWIDRGMLETAYRELRTRYGDNWVSWGKINEKDPLFSLISQLKAPPIDAIPKWEQKQIAQAYDATKRLNSLAAYQPPEQLGRVGPWTQYGIDETTWKQLPSWKKTALAIFRTMPGQAAQSAINLGILGAAVGGPVGAGVGALTGAGLGVAMYNEQTRAAQIIAAGGHYEMPGWFKTMLLLDELYRQSQSAVGLFTQLVYAFQDPQKYGTLEEILGNFPAAWQAGRGIYSAIPAGLEALKTPGQFTHVELTSPQDVLVKVPEGRTPPAWALVEMRRALAKGEMTPDQVVEWYASTFGFSAEVSDLIGGYILDPLDLVGVAGSKAIGYTAKATGHPIAAKAFLEQPGSFPDLLTGLRYYAHLARELPQSETAKLNPLAKFIAGLDREGRVIDFTKPENRNMVTGLYTAVFGLDAKSRATTILQNTVDGLTNLLTMEKESPQRMVGILESLAAMNPADAVRAAQTSIRITVGGQATEVPLPRWFSSVEAQHIPMAIRDGMPKIRELLDNYNSAAVDRKIIHLIASVIEEDPYVVLRDLHTGNNEQIQARLRQFMDDLRTKAAAGDEQSANLLAIMENTPLDAASLKQIADRFYGSSAPAFDVDQFRYQILVELADHIDGWAAKYFNVKPMGFAQSLIEVNKRIQGLLLLGLNPTYFINNALNNIITLAWDGLLKRMNSRQLQAFLTEFDMSPSRLHTGIGAAEIGEIEIGRVAEMSGEKKVARGAEIGRRIQEANQARGRMRDILRLANKGKKAQLFGLLSQKVERWSSQIAMVNGMLEYWNKAWKEGKGFQRMPDDLRMALDTVQPGLAEKVRKAIERGKSKKQIEDEIFKKLRAQRLEDFLTPGEKETLQNTYPNVYRELDDAILHARTKQDVLNAFARARQEILGEAAEAVRERVHGRMVEAMERVTGEGTQAVLDMIDQMATTFAETWLNHLIRMEQIAQQAMRLSGRERAALWRQTMAEQQAFWSLYRNQEHASWLGIYQALGADSTSPEFQMFLATYGEYVDNINYFYTARNQAYENYWARIEEIDADTLLSDAERQVARTEAWYAVNQEIARQYRTMVMVEDELQGLLDDMFAVQYSRQFGGGQQAYQEAMASRNRLRQVRRKTQQAMLLYRDGQIAENVLRDWGDLLSDEQKRVIGSLNNGQPLYMLDPQLRDTNNRVFYESIYQPLVAEMMNERNSVPLSSPGQNPTSPAPAGAATEVPPQAGEAAAGTHRSVLWRIVRERLPDIVQTNEAGQPLPHAERRVVAMVNKYLDADYRSLDEISPEELNRAIDLKFLPKRIDRFNAGSDPRPDASAPEVELLRYQVNHDATGVRNRTAFDSRIEKLNEKGARYYVAFFDLRGLSKTNKEYSHAVGDAYIQLVIDKANEIGITLYRMSRGDEFAAIFEHKNKAHEIMQLLDEAVSSSLVEHEGHYYAGAKFHYGIAKTLGEADELAERAHRAETLVNEAGETVLKYDRATYSLREVEPPEEPTTPPPLTQAEWTRRRNLTRAAEIEMGMLDDQSSGRRSARDVVYRELLDFFMEKENNPARARDTAAAMMTVWDGLAEHWAKLYGQDADDFYRQFIIRYEPDDYPLDAPLYQQERMRPHYFAKDWSYSKLMRAVLELKSPMSPDDFIRYLKNRGVSDDEMYFSGIDILVSDAQMSNGKIRRENVVTFLHDFGVEYDESWNFDLSSDYMKWYQADDLLDAVNDQVEKARSKYDQSLLSEAESKLLKEVEEQPQLLNLEYLYRLVTDANELEYVRKKYPGFDSLVLKNFLSFSDEFMKLHKQKYMGYSYSPEGTGYRELLIAPKYLHLDNYWTETVFFTPDGEKIIVPETQDPLEFARFAKRSIRQWLKSRNIEYDPAKIEMQYDFVSRNRIAIHAKVGDYEFKIVREPHKTRKGAGKTTHFGEDTLIHVRMQDLKRDGRRVLLIDEIQSDILQNLEKQVRQDRGKEKLEIIKYEDVRNDIENEDVAFTMRMKYRGKNYLVEGAGKLLDQYLSSKIDMPYGQYLEQHAKYAVVDNRSNMIWLFADKADALFKVAKLQERYTAEAPFMKTWVDMALRRILHYASINDYDAVMITPGELHVERYYPIMHGDRVVVQYIPDTKEWEVFLYKNGILVNTETGPHFIDRYFDAPTVEAILKNKTVREDGIERYTYVSDKADIEFVRNRKLLRYYNEKVIPTFQKYVNRWGVEAEENYLYRDDGTKIPAPLFPIVNKLKTEVIQNKQPLFQQELPGVWYSSRLVDAINQLPQEKLTKEQLVSYLKKFGVKEAEIYWTGLDAYLDNANGILRKQDIVDYVRRNRVEVAVTMRDADWGKVNRDEIFEWLTTQVYPINIKAKSALLEYMRTGRIDDLDKIIRAGIPTTLLAAVQELSQLGEMRPSAFAKLNQVWKGDKNRRTGILVPVFARRRWSVWQVTADGREIPISDLRKQLSITDAYLSLRIGLSDKKLTGTSVDANNRIILEFNDGSKYMIKPNDVGGAAIWPVSFGHYEEFGVALHVRLSDAGDDIRTLILEEVQSDVHQQARKFGGYQGYAPDAFTIGKVIKEAQLVDFDIEQTSGQFPKQLAGVVPITIEATGIFEVDGVQVPKQISITLDWVDEEAGTYRVSYLISGDSYGNVRVVNKPLSEFSQDVVLQAIKDDLQDTTLYAFGYPRDIGDIKEYAISSTPDKVILESATQLPGYLPFEKTWDEVGFRWALRQAIDGGYDRIELVSGDIQQARYIFASYKSSYDAKRRELTIYYRMPESDTLNKYVIEGLSPEKLQKVIFDEDAEAIANRLRNGEVIEQKILFEPTGGGLKRYYDVTLRNKINDILKKFGTQIVEENGRRFVYINDSMRRVFSEKPPPLFQSAKVKGMIDWMDDGRAIITAFKNSADISTFIHETGHLLLTMLPDEDLRVVEAWLKEQTGLKDFELGWQYGTGKYREQKELFARAFERYMMEGRAPKPELRNAFQRIKDLLIQIYRKITRLDVDINDQMRTLFDKWLSDYEADESRLSMHEIELVSDYTKSHVSRETTQAMAEKAMPATLMQETGDEGKLPPIPPREEPPEINAVQSPLGTVHGLQDRPQVESAVEGTDMQVMQSLDNGLGRALENFRPADSGGARLPEETENELRRYLGGVYSDLADTRMGAIRWGETRRDFALLNYGKRRGFDNAMSAIFPYQFWYTRTMLNWLLRLANKPSILANYARLMRMAMRREEKDGFPQRLKGKIPIAMPFLPEWMGSYGYVDPYRQALPFLQIASPFVDIAAERNMLIRKTESILREMRDEEQISDAQLQEAIATRSTPIWKQAYAQAQNEVDTEYRNPVDMMFSIYGPSLPIGIAYQYMMGTPERISQLPITRTIQNVTATLGIGGPRGVNIEKWIRTATGLPDVDRWEDYRVDRELSNMVADGLIDANKAIRAMIERQGSEFEAAQRRVSQTAIVRQLGAGLAMDIFPEGEGEMRAMRNELTKAYEAQAAGDTQALQKFWDTYPEYDARRMAMKDPQNRLRAFLISTIWERYSDLDKAQKRLFREAAGNQFDELFLDKKTRSYGSIDTDTLALWANTLGEPPISKSHAAKMEVDWLPPAIAEKVKRYYEERDKLFPQTEIKDELQKLFTEDNREEFFKWQNKYLAENPEIIPYVIGEENNLYGLPADIQQYVYMYRAARDERFPDIFQIQDRYFSLPVGQRRAFRQAHPELMEYWQFQREFAAAYPKAAAYILSENSLSRSILGESSSGFSSGAATKQPPRPYLTRSEVRRFSRGLVMQLYALRYRGEKLMPGARAELERIWENLGKPFGSVDEWLENAVLPTIE